MSSQTTDEENNMNEVHAVPLSAKKFTQKDLELTLKYVNPEVYPGYYDNSVLPKDYQYVDRRIVKLSEIRDLIEIFNDIDKKEMIGISQPSLIRMLGRGQNTDEVIAHLRKMGYELSHVPPAAVQGPDGNLYWVDGRSRKEGLELSNFENIIVDYYVGTSWAEIFKQAIARNKPSTPRSEMTHGDILNHCKGFIELGWLQRDYQTIRSHIIDITNNSLKKDTLERLCSKALVGKGYTDSVIHFDEKRAEKWLKTNGYHDNENNNGIYYKVVAASAWSKGITSTANLLIDNLLNEGKRVKEVRVVLHTGTLEGADPSKSWRSKIDNFRNGWNNELKNVENAFFKDSKRKGVIKLYGAIPAVKDLSQYYPMDKLVMFHVGQLKDNLFSDIDLENSLNEVLAA
jgi:hypothetical protein